MTKAPENKRIMIKRCVCKHICIKKTKNKKKLLIICGMFWYFASPDRLSRETVVASLWLLTHTVKSIHSVLRRATLLLLHTCHTVAVRPQGSVMSAAFPPVMSSFSKSALSAFIQRDVHLHVHTHTHTYMQSVAMISPSLIWVMLRRALICVCVCPSALTLCTS